MAEHGTPDQITSQAPFIQALVQKSVTAITKLAGRLSFGCYGKERLFRKRPIVKIRTIVRDEFRACGFPR
jgi:hypothetical protein